MTLSNIRRVVRSAIMGWLLAVMTLLVVPVAGAQQLDPAPGLSAAAAPEPAQTPTPPPPGSTPPPYWELIGGFEWDTHATGYAFFGPSYVRPFKPGMAWTVNVF